MSQPTISYNSSPLWMNSSPGFLQWVRSKEFNGQPLFGGNIYSQFLDDTGQGGYNFLEGSSINQDNSYNQSQQQDKQSSLFNGPTFDLLGGSNFFNGTYHNGVYTSQQSNNGRGLLSGIASAFTGTQSDQQDDTGEGGDADKAKRNTLSDRLSSAIRSTWKSYNGFKNAKTQNDKLNNLGNMMGDIGGLVGSLVPNKSEYDGVRGNVTSTMDQIYSGISDAANMFGPIGSMVGGAMKIGDAASKVLNKIGIGNDAQTTGDAILGSSFFSLTPVGLLNNIFTKKTQSMRVDTQAFANAGSSYTGAQNRANEAKEKSEKRYGLFSRGAYHRANELITNAKQIQERVGNITNRAQKRRDLQSGMTSVNRTRYMMQQRGGYKQGQVRAGKYGLLLPTVDDVQAVLRAGAKLQHGGITSAFYNNGKKEDVKIENPYFVNYDQDGGTITLDAPKDSTEVAAQLDWYNSEDGADFANDWTLGEDDISGKYQFTPREQQETFSTITPIADNGMKIDKKKAKKYEKEEGEIDRVLMDVQDYMQNTPKEEWPRFLQRLVEDRRMIDFIDDEGNEVRGSHYMSNIGRYVYPEIAEVDGKLEKLSPTQAVNYAKQTKNFIEFDSDKDAERFANHYKEIFPRFVSEMPPAMWDSMMAYLGNPDLTGVRIIREFDPDAQSRTIGNRIYYNANGDIEEQLIHELTHRIVDKDEALAKQYASFYSKPFGEPIDDDYLRSLGADLDYVKGFDNDPNVYYQPNELLARLAVAQWHTDNHGDGWSPQFFANARQDESQYGDNFRDLLHMYDDEHLSQLFSIRPSLFMEVTDDGVESFQKGGAMNVIPEGALHKEKHHIDDHVDGLDKVTKKGIPVISEEDGEIVQQAEIERQEIIFRLEVTEKMEELYKKYYEDKTSAEEKNAAAIEAGKILAEEIMHNTDDRTNNII